MLTSRRTTPNSLHQLISLGIYPEQREILVAEGAIAPRAAYEPIARQIIEVDTPGLTGQSCPLSLHPGARPLFGLE